MTLSGRYLQIASYSLALMSDWVLDTDLYNPVAEGTAVEQLGLVLKCAVYLDHGAAYGRVEVAGGLHTLYGSELLACADLVVNLGHVYVYDVS